MKAVTLRQPWASLVFWYAADPQQRVKAYETRDWPTRYRGPLAIHAAKRPMGSAQTDVLEDLVYHGMNMANVMLGLADANRARGCVVGTVELVDCIEMTEQFIAKQSAFEQMTGAWVPGRFAWQLDNPQAFAQPIPAKGMQGLWEWEHEAVGV